MIRRALFSSLLALAVLRATPAAAQQDDDLIPPARTWVSPERFVVEAHVGPYHPSGGTSAFDSYFRSDDGPWLSLELDVIGYRLDNWLYVTGGGGLGTVHFSGKARDELGSATSEDTTLALLPLQLVAALRIDALARQLEIPFIFTGKLGYQWMHWSAQTGGQSDATGWSVGLLWAAQVALDLDTFEPSAARAMDEEWGINHSFLFFELFGFDPSAQSLPIGDTSWNAGLGFTF